MNNIEKQNNRVFLSGTVVTKKQFSHEVYGEGFFEMDFKVNRLSGQSDILPITISERLIDNQNIDIGSKLNINGQFRSYNKIMDNKSKLMLTVFVRELIENANEDRNPNNIVLSGYICKSPIYRTTPFNREICDVLIAVNRAYNKSDYIPCIAWGRNARFVKNLAVGEKVALSGRIQSREYQKRLSDEDIRKMVAYEVSVSKLAAFDNVDTFDLDKEFGEVSYENNYIESVM